MRRIRPAHALNAGKHIAAGALTHQAPDPDKAPPKFSFQHLQRSHCITLCTKEERVSFVDRMYRLSQMTWAALRQAHRHKLGYEIIPRDSIKAGIPQNITEDVNFIAFRFYQMAPMVGFRADDGTFHVVWFDRDFTLYEHG
jgi:hypothetical protein